MRVSASSKLRESTSRERRKKVEEEKNACPLVAELRTHHDRHASVQSAIFGTIFDGLSNHAVELLSIFGKGAHRNRRRRLRTNVLVSDYMQSGTRGLDPFTLEHEIHIDVR